MVFKFITFDITDDINTTFPHSLPPSPQSSICYPLCYSCTKYIKDRVAAACAYQLFSAPGPPELPSTTPPPRPSPDNRATVGHCYTYQQILKATNGFNVSNLVKHGHSGDLFTGVLKGRKLVVIKKISPCSVEKKPYKVELDFFKEVNYGRFVPFLGHCLEKWDEKFLVYKYMPYKDLASSFYWKDSSKDDKLLSLDWIRRLKIATGTAEGLAYLHERNTPLVHGNVQASSILLDENYEVRLGSLSEVRPQYQGNMDQSRNTCIHQVPQSSDQCFSANADCEYDVYCFGKVLLELITGNLGLSSSNDPETMERVQQTLSYISIHDKMLMREILDQNLMVGVDFLDEVWAMAIVARSCLNPKPDRRPSMKYILKALENPLKVINGDL